VTFAEGVTKTRQSGLYEKYRLVKPKMIASNTSRCPIAFYKLYLAKHPLALCKSGLLYLSVIVNPATAVWYKSLRWDKCIAIYV